MEVVIVSGILSIFSIFIVGLLMVTRDAMAIQNIGTPVRTEAKKTMDFIARELRESDVSSDDLVTLLGGADLDDLAEPLALLQRNRGGEDGELAEARGGGHSLQLYTSARAPATRGGKGKVTCDGFLERG